MKPPTRLFHRNTFAAAMLAALLTTTACSGSTDTSAPAAAAATDAADTNSSGSTTPAVDAANVARSASDVFDSSYVHTISVEFDVADYEAMLSAYRSDGTKEWIEATVTIDGVVYESAGVRLKGNSSLRGLGGAGATGAGVTGDGVTDAPEELPWLIRLDKYVDGQQHDGVSDFVVRSNNSETSLNEAVALELLAAAGLASQDAMAVRFSVNGSDETLRLVIEHPDDVWMADNFDADGALYKAESTGDYSYRGDDPDAYDDVFDQEAGKDNADLTPLMEFLDFINNADDETFASEIGDRLDVDSFATYLAMQEIVQNFDDIDGPGNNSYLYYDTAEQQFTVVPWDHNLAFGDAGFGIGGAAGGPGGRDGLPPRGELREGFEPPSELEPRQQPGRFGGEGGQGGPGGRSNILVQRLQALDEFSSLYGTRLAELTTTLIDSGVGADIVATWAAVLEDGASDLVPVATIAAEAQRLADSL